MLAISHEVSIYRNLYSKKNMSSPMLVVGLFQDLMKFLRPCSRLESVQLKRQNRKEKGSKNIYAPMLRVLSCLTNWQGQAVTGS